MFSTIDRVLQAKSFHILISVFVILYLWFMILSPISNGWQSALTVWKTWQTLNASVIAFISTLIIFQSTRITQQLIAMQKRNAAKAFMPIALAELCDYMKSLIQLSENLYHGNEVFELKVKPKIPEQSFKRIEKFIEESVPQDQKLVEHLILVINCIQVFDSRLTTLLTDNRLVDKQKRASYQINQFILLHALVSGMFGYIRNNVSSYNIDKLDKNRFDIKDCPLYMTDIEMEEYANKEINFELFVK